MIWFVTVVHVILCLFLILIILLQAGKGAEIGAVFGGSSQTLFGSRGAATFLSKVTTVCAIGFMLTSLGLVILNSQEAGRSLMNRPPSTGKSGGPATNAALTTTPTGTPTMSATPAATATPAAKKQSSKKP